MNQDHINYLRSDSDLGPVVEEHGVVELKPAEDFFERLIVSILRQQVSMASARATRERLTDTVQITPNALLQIDQTTLRDVGLSRQKASYVHNTAEAFIENGYSRSLFEVMTNEQVVSELTTITGVGTWTAKMQLMFSLARPDVFPVEDLGIRKGMNALYSDSRTRSDMIDLAEKWSPYRSYASLYLWKIVD